MPSKQLMLLWGLLDFFLLAAGGALIAFSVVLRAPDAIRNLVFPASDLNFSLALGIIYVVTFAVSIGAVIQQNHITIGLAILNWVLMGVTVVTVIFGSTMWFMTLQEHANFANVWNAASPANRIAVQEALHCCGFVSNTAVEATGFCANPANALNNGCSIPFVTISDTMLMDAFTTVYSFTAITVMLFIATMCVIKKRQEQERFRRIDAKRGGRGFV